MEHHFVPQFYLRGFRDASVPEGQEPWLWVVDLREKVVERRAPKNVGKAANYYAFPEFDQGADETVEGILSKVESAAAPIVRELVAGELRELTGQARADSLFFMALLVARVPFFRNSIEQFAAEVAKTMLQFSASHPANFESMLREALKGHRELMPEEIEETRKWILDETKYTIRASPKLSLVAGFEAVLETIYPIFDAMNAAICRPSGGQRFITSDCPVSWVDPTLPSPWCHGLEMRKVEVTFPVAPGVCLLSTWDGHTGTVTVPDATVTEFNRRRVVFAERYVFADNSDRAQWALDVRRQIEQKM